MLWIFSSKILIPLIKSSHKTKKNFKNKVSYKIKALAKTLKIFSFFFFLMSAWCPDDVPIVFY